MLITPPLHCSVIFFYTQYMLTLSDASYDTKEILKWGGLFIASFVIILSLVLFIKQTFFPTPPPKPTVAFGKLTPQLFPENAISKTPAAYTINTVSGALPAFPDQIKIYRMQANIPDLLNLSNAKQMVQKENFTQNPDKTSDTLYTWTDLADSDNAGLSSKITVDIVNDNFNLTSDYLNNPMVISGRGLQPAAQSITAAQTFLTILNSFPSDIDQTKTQTEPLSVANGTLTTTTSLSSAQAIRVKFYQQDVNKLPIYYEKPGTSNIDIVVGPNDKILEADYVHQTVTDQFATYPLKSTAQAFADLKQGYAYIASYQGTSTDISINNVILAYYIGSQPQDYLMPVFVFEGNDNFIAYVPAVTDEWINK